MIEFNSYQLSWGNIVSDFILISIFENSTNLHNVLFRYIKMRDVHEMRSLIKKKGWIFVI